MYTPKTREEYIASCLFFNGNEDISSYRIGGMWAMYELKWVEWHYTDEGLQYLRENLKHYKSFGLGYFRKDDGVPITLKAIYWNRWYNKGVEGMGTAEEFKQFYIYEIIKTYYISKCRYYTGDDDFDTKLQGVDSMFVFYEQGWVGKQLSNKVVKEDTIHTWLMDGDVDWLKSFNVNDGVPVSIKALLWNRHQHWCGGYNPYEIEIENFKQWYKKEYLKEQ